MLELTEWMIAQEGSHSLCGMTLETNSSVLPEQITAETQESQILFQALEKSLG